MSWSHVTKRHMMAMRPTVTYTPYATSSKEKTGNVITFTQFEEGGLLTETCNDKESSDKYDSESLMIGFRGIFVGIPQHQKGYLVYVPSTRKVISSYDVVFDESVLVCYHIRQNLI